MWSGHSANDFKYFLGLHVTKEKHCYTVSVYALDRSGSKTLNNKWKNSRTMFLLSVSFLQLSLCCFLEVFPLEDHVKYFSSTDWFPFTNSDEHSLFSSAGVPPRVVKACLKKCRLLEIYCSKVICFEQSKYIGGQRVLYM